MTPVHELRQLQVSPAQRFLKNRLLDAVEASRLPHLGERQVSAKLVDGRLEFTLRHAQKAEVVLRLVAGEDGSGWIDCEALQPEFHLDFDRADHPFAVEAVALTLHGWASVHVGPATDRGCSTTVLLETPEGESFWEESYWSDHRREGEHTISWTSTRDGRVPPPTATRER